MFSGRWRIVLILVMVTVAGTALVMFLHAGSWEQTDQMAGTFGFFLGLAGLFLGVVTLLLQVKANQDQQRSSAAGHRSANRSGTSTPGRKTKLRWLLRLGAPDAATGAGGCLLDVALGATILFSGAAMTLAVPAQGTTPPYPAALPYPTVTPSERPTAAASPAQSAAPSPSRSNLAGSITSAQPRVQDCAVFAGTARIPRSFTLVLAVFDLDGSGDVGSPEPVLNAERPLQRTWRGVQHFSPVADGRYDVVLMAVSRADFTRWRSGESSEEDLLDEATELDSVPVIRVPGDRPDRCRS